MDKELQELKSVLRSLVVSTPARMDVRTLARDYRSMMGAPIPLAKFGYRDILVFLKERCSDCFLFQGTPSNPVLTLIVPDSLKHIDQFVQRQKPSAITKMKGKRTSVHIPNKPPKFESSSNRICETFQRSYSSNQNINHHPPERKSNPSVGKGNYVAPHLRVKSNNQPETKSRSHSPEIKPKYSPLEEKSKENYFKPVSRPNQNPGATYHSEVKSTNMNNEPRSNTHTNNMYNGNKEIHKSKPSIRQDNKENPYIPSEESSSKFSKKRLSGYYDSGYDAMCLTSEECTDTGRTYNKEDNDSGRQTSSSSTKKALMEEVMHEVFELIKENKDGVLCKDIFRLYRERYGRELELSRAGHSNINSLLCELEPRVQFAPEAAGVRVYDARAPPPRAPRPRPAPAPLARAHPPRPPPVDPDDALPGVNFDPDVFPEDCMHFMESIPALPLDDITSGCMVEVAVGEVYSPSHLWLQRLGPDHSHAMDRLMDEMTEFYTSVEGGSRSLARGAVRVGHYCASLYEGDWHRALIVKLVDSNTVKVRHVDYGTVDSVAVASLKPLLREWGSLPAQAVRARLAGLRPCSGGRRWPHAAAAALLRLVTDKRFIANVVAVDREEETIETFLIDTSGEDDVCVSTELIRAGHADERPDSALRVSAVPPSPSVNLRLLASDLLTFGHEHDASSEVSASASELVDAPPRRMPLWEPESPPHSPPETVVSTATSSSRLLARKLALLDLAQRLKTESPSPPDTVVTRDASKTLKTTEGSEDTKAPEALKAPEFLKAPEAINSPEFPKAPEAIHSPELPKAPEAINAPEFPKALEAIKASQPPKVSKTSHKLELAQSLKTESEIPSPSQPATVVATTTDIDYAAMIAFRKRLSKNKAKKEDPTISGVPLECLEAPKSQEALKVSEIKAPEGSESPVASPPSSAVSRFLQRRIELHRSLYAS